MSSPSPGANTTAIAALVVPGTRLDGSVSGVIFDQCVMSKRQVCADGGECVAGVCSNGDKCACPDGSACNATTSKCADDKTSCVAGVTATKVLLPASAPCFRASGQTRLRILGRNFGSGKTTVNELKDPRFATVVQRVLVTSLSNSNSPPVKCVVSATNQADSVVTSDGTIECVLAADLPRGPVDVSMVQAFRVLSAASFNITPYAACPCGSFARLDGQRCAECPDGALCAGAHLSAVARPDFWETHVDEWAAAPRFIKLALLEPGSITSAFWVAQQKTPIDDFGYHDGVNTSATVVAPFVPCIDYGTCRANNTCAWTAPNAAPDGCSSLTTTWMCSSCPPDCQKFCSGPNANVCTCTPCPLVNRQATAAALFFGLSGVVLLAIAVAKKEALVHEAKGVLRCAGRCICCQPGCQRFNDQLDTEPPGENNARKLRKPRAGEKAGNSTLDSLKTEVEQEAKKLQHIARLVARDDWFACSQCTAEWPAERAPDDPEDGLGFSLCRACAGVGRAPAAVDQRERVKALAPEEHARIGALGRRQLRVELSERGIELPEDPASGPSCFQRLLSAAPCCERRVREKAAVMELRKAELGDELLKARLSAPDATAETRAAAAKAARDRKRLAGSAVRAWCCRPAPPASLPSSSAHEAASESTKRRAEVWAEVHRRLPMANLFPTNRACPDPLRRFIPLRALSPAHVHPNPPSFSAPAPSTPPSLAKACFSSTRC